MSELLGKQYTSKDKKPITDDWENALSSLRRYKDLHINNRVGPLVVGIYLKMGRLKNYYTPIYYVHNLCREFPQLTLTLSIQEKMITPDRHKLLYLPEAESLAKQAYISISGDLYINEIISGYEKYFMTPNPSSYVEYEDLALFCGWTKNRNKIEYALDAVYKNLKLWSEERYFSKEGGFENWFRGLEYRVWKGNELNIIVEKEILRHKLIKVPERKILL